MLDIEKFVEGLHDYIGGAMRPLAARIKALEAKADADKFENIAPVLESMFGKWALEFERRAQDQFQREIDRMPKPKDGHDGFSVDDFEVVLDEHTLKLTMRCGERFVTREIKIPFPLYRGVHKFQKSYDAGDAVTFIGQLWISLQDNNTDSPPSDKWRRAVKKGQDGKDVSMEGEQ